MADVKFVEVENLREAPIRARKTKNSKKLSAIPKGKIGFVAEDAAKQLAAKKIVKLVDGGSK